MRFDTCLKKIADLSTWDIRFHIIAESNGRRWPISFCDNAARMLEDWKTGGMGTKLPENGDYIHGLLFISEVDGSAMAACEADLEGLDFEGLMWYLQKKTT